MAETYVKTTEEQRRSVTNSTGTDNREFYTGDNSPGDLSRAAGMVSNSNSSARSNAAPRATSIMAMQSTYGNRAVQRYIRSSAPSRPNLSVPVQREVEGGMWDVAKNLLGVDQIGPAMNKVVKKAQSGVEHVGQTLFDWLMPSASDGNMPAVPGSELGPSAHDVPGMGFGPKMDEDVVIGGGDYAMWQSNFGSTL